MKDFVSIYQQPALLFGALAHPIRLAMVELLRDGEACVCHIQSVLGLRQAYASQHLNILRQAGLVNSRKEGTRVYYELVSNDVDSIVDQAKSFLMASNLLSPEEFEPAFELFQSECRCPQCADSQAVGRIKEA